MARSVRGPTGITQQLFHLAPHLPPRVKSITCASLTKFDYQATRFTLSFTLANVAPAIPDIPCRCLFFLFATTFVGVA